MMIIKIYLDICLFHSFSSQCQMHNIVTIVSKIQYQIDIINTGECSSLYYLCGINEKIAYNVRPFHNICMKIKSRSGLSSVKSRVSLRLNSARITSSTVSCLRVSGSGVCSSQSSLVRNAYECPERENEDK